MTRRHISILRLRSIEHRMAQQQLARAKREEAQLNVMQNRIAALRKQQPAGAVMTSGAVLAAQCEMATRLDLIARATAHELDNATAAADHRQQAQNRAQQRVESAGRHLENARRSAAKQAEINAATGFCRKPDRQEDGGE